MKWANLTRACMLVLTLLGGTSRVLAYDYYFKPIHEQFDAIARRLCQLDFDNRRQTILPATLDSLDAIVSQTGNRQLRARAIYWRVRMGQLSAQPAWCIEQLEEAARLSQPGFDYDMACISYQLAGNYDRIGKYMRCYDLATQACTVFSQVGDNYFLGNTQLLLSQLFTDIADNESALRCLLLAKEAYAQAGYPLNRIYFFQALLTDDNAQSVALQKRAVATGGNDWGTSLQALMHISSTFLTMQQPDSAETYINQAARLLNQNAPDNPLFRGLLTSVRAQVYYQLGRLDDAMADLRSLEPDADVLKDERFMLKVYRYLWLVSERQGRQADAYRYLTVYHEAYAQQQEELRKREVPKAQAREAIARQEDRIKLLEQESELNRNYMYVAMLIAAVVVLLGLALFMFFYHRYRIRRLENRELRNSLEQEALIYQMNRKNFEDDIKQKDCEISSSTLLLANKNEVLQQLHDITKRYSDDGLIPDEYVRQVNAVIGDSLRNDDEWSRFKLHFTSVHPDFFVKLKKRAADLTENDLRLCAYISIGMRAKQIAEMLSISPDSVNSNRYRLRKKLGLEKGQKLDDYIRQM